MEVPAGPQHAWTLAVASVAQRNVHPVLYHITAGCTSKPILSKALQIHNLLQLMNVAMT